MVSTANGYHDVGVVARRRVEALVPPARGATRARESSCGVVVNRDAEQAVIEELLEAAATGRGQAVVIRGTAGIGKTTLLRVLEDRAAAMRMRVLRCTRGPARVRLSVGWGTASVEPLVRGDRFGDTGVGTEPELDPAPCEGASLMAALHRLYWRSVELAEACPLVLTIDDAHWLDELSLRWLAYMVSRVEHESILLAVAGRAGGLEDNANVWSAILSGSRIVDLGPLGDADSEQLLTLLLGHEPDPSLSAECCRETAGNPFLLTEVARAVRARDATPDGTAAVGFSGEDERSRRMSR